MFILGKGIDFINFADKHILYFENCCSRIINNQNIELAKDELNAMYQYIKDITHEYFEENRLNPSYKFLKQSLLMCEEALPQEFIIESTPDYFPNQMSRNIPSNHNINFKLDWIVYMTRRYLDNNRCIFAKQNKSFNDLDLANECRKSSNKVIRLCKLLDLPVQEIIIYPGFSKYYKLYDGSGFHFINMIVINDKKYIIDCTYRQFFVSVYNNLNRIGIVDVSGCRPGIFMTMTEERKKLADTILKRGWFEATDENIKYYFDGFALSYRNGLYYDITNDYSYTTNYTASNYMDFINGLDNQVYHESYETLGFQRTLKPTEKNNI